MDILSRNGFGDRLTPTLELAVGQRARVDGMSEHAASRDPTVYRVEDDVGEHEIQTYILELLRPLVERYFAQRGTQGHVGSDQFIYWRQFEPQACVAPDIYVLPGVSQAIAIGVWKVWERGGIVPNFALEVVGRDPHKDYQDSPRRYAELGVEELVVFDPFPGPDRVAFAVYRRGSDGLRQVETTQGDRVFSEQLDCHLRRVGAEATTRLRLATGESGQTLFPTTEEAERTAKEAALARIAELERKLREG